VEEYITPEYRAQHAACPACGSGAVCRILISWDFVPDERRARCDECKWVGVVDDLKPLEV
jgi:predicted RNA-binding Zn-ribbon protein involved in translation (DUF1610 family)